MTSRAEFPSLEEMKQRGDNALHTMRLLIADRQMMAALTKTVVRIRPEGPRTRQTRPHD